MTAPSAITASYPPDCARRLATRGSSKAPGAQTMSIRSSSTPCRRRPSVAPSTRRSTIAWLNLLLASDAQIRVGLDHILVEEMPQPVPLGLQVAQVLRVGLHPDRDPLRDLQ